MKIIIICLIILVAFLVYEIYQFKTKYRLIKKFSINNGEGTEYYFVLQRKSDKKSFKIQVNKETYDLCDNNDRIIIF